MRQLYARIYILFNFQSIYLFVDGCSVLCARVKRMPQVQQSEFFVTIDKHRCGCSFFFLFSDVWTWAAHNLICILVSEEPSEMLRLYPIRVLKASRCCLPSSRNWSTISFAYTANKAHSTLMTRGKMHTFLEFTCSPDKREKKTHTEWTEKKMNTKRDRRRQTKHCYGFWLKWRKIKIK